MSGMTNGSCYGRIKYPWACGRRRCKRRCDFLQLRRPATTSAVTLRRRKSYGHGRCSRRKTYGLYSSESCLSMPDCSRREKSSLTGLAIGRGQLGVILHLTYRMPGISADIRIIEQETYGCLYNMKSFELKGSCRWLEDNERS